jgi:CRP-like cAMP-binding protein
MTDLVAAPINRILAALPEGERARLAPDLEPVELAYRQKLASAQRRIEHVYFPESGLVSVMGGLRGDLPVEVGIVGREGVVNLAALLESESSPTESMVQSAGRGLALPTSRARVLMDESPAFNAVIRRYVHAFMMQEASNVVASARASVGQRLARWLLMAHDRLDRDEMPLTHEFLSMMLAVRRPSVTLALSDFEASGWVQRRRGTIVLLDRESLLAEAAGFYGMAEQELDRALAAESGDFA